MIINLLHIAEDRIIAVQDKDTVSLGGQTLEFVVTPWVHWPETMLTYLREDRIMFTCDFFGCHLATSEIFVSDESRVYESAKRYYAEIMMPFRNLIQRHLEKLKGYGFDIIATSHGPIYKNPKFILDAYSDWASDIPNNMVVVPYVTMHGSTELMVNHFAKA